MKGMQLWVFTLLEYDSYGNAKVLKSFVKPAKESPVRYEDKKQSKEATKPVNRQMGEKSLW